MGWSMHRTWHLVHIRSCRSIGYDWTVTIEISWIRKCIEVIWLRCHSLLRMVVIAFSLSKWLLLLRSTLAFSVLSSKLCSSLLLALVILGSDHHRWVPVEVTIWFGIRRPAHHDVFIDFCVQELAVRKLICERVLTNHIWLGMCKVELGKPFSFKVCLSLIVVGRLCHVRILCVWIVPTPSPILGGWNSVNMRRRGNLGVHTWSLLRDLSKRLAKWLGIVSLLQLAHASHV